MAWRWGSQRSWPEAFFSRLSALRANKKNKRSSSHRKICQERIKGRIWDQGLGWWEIKYFIGMALAQYKLRELISIFPCRLMYQSNWSLNIHPPPPPPGIPRTFDVFCCPGGREFDELSLPQGGAFDHYSKGVGSLIASFDFMLHRADFMWRDK